MEQDHDEHIDCADCGAPFVFSAQEAAVFADRGLTAPKRCKDCRRARKDRASNGSGRGAQGRHDGGPAPRLQDQRGSSRWGHAGTPMGAPSPAHAHGNGQGGRWNAHAPRHRASPPRYTGDVNEYRSPMQDGHSASPYGLGPRLAATQGEYRSPMSGGLAVPTMALRPPSGTRHEAGPRPPRGQRSATSAPAHPSPPGADGVDRRSPPRRPQAEMFAITCDACGAQAEVPFKPAEGREVYCPTCYRARRTAT